MSGMGHKAEFRFSTPMARMLYQALAPELIDQEGMRSTVDLSCADQTTLIMTVHAEDLAALRAALNMWLRLVNVADEVAGIAFETQINDQAGCVR